MSKCQTCVHYEYQAGISLGLAAKIGMPNAPSTPTCYCHYAQIAWKRWSADVRKPRGIPCDYRQRQFTCTYCGSHNVTGALIISSADSEMVCKKCLKANATKGADQNG